jgi:hypothetical protein
MARHDTLPERAFGGLRNILEKKLRLACAQENASHPPDMSVFKGGQEWSAGGE